MLNSVYSRIFYLCTIMLMFACALTGLIVVLAANHMHEKEAYDRFNSTARIMLSRIRDDYTANDDTVNPETLRTALEQYTLNENVDCYVFDSDGSCIVRTDYQSDEKMELSTLLQMEADKEPYCQVGAPAGNFTETTATYIERFDLNEASYYLMLLFPAAHIDDYFSKLLIILVIAVLVTGLLGALLFYFNTKQALKPVLQITRQAENYAKGDFSARLEQTGDPEMDRLIITMNRMADFIDKNERSRRRFVSDVSHEMKTPMTTIGGFVDGILDGTIPPERQNHYLQIVSDETKRLSRLVRSMLDISQLQDEKGMPDEKKMNFDMEECAGLALVNFEKKINDKHINVQVDMPEHPVYTFANQDAVTQVVYNLVDNAVKFCPEGGTLGLTIKEGGGKAYVSVSNDGETIPAEELPLVFDRFHKLDKSRSKNRDGWGLGLYIVKTIVCSHGENISVTSRDGKTEFTFTMPLAN